MWPIFVALWVAMSALMVLTMYNDVLRALLIHGKVRKDTHLRHRGVLGTLLRLEMRKSGWIYFYFVGAVYNLGITLALIATPYHPLTQQLLTILQSGMVAPPSLVLVEIRPETTMVIALLGLQDTRRFLESWFITEFGDAKMHVALIVAGLVHYMGFAPSVLSYPQSLATDKDTNWTRHPLLTIAGLLLFLYGSYQQFYHNKLLAQQKRANNGQHVLPRGGWFDAVLCPLYSAELLIYVALVLVCGLGNPMVNLVCGWVTLNQTICAYFGKQWYHTKFRSDETLPTWVLVPGVW